MKFSVFTAVLILFGCSQSTENLVKEEYNPLQDQIGHIVLRGKKYFFEVPCLYSESKKEKDYFVVKNNIIHFEKVLNIELSDTVELERILDKSTFRMIGLTDNEKRKIRNPYYFEGRMNCYYADSKNFYTYLNNDNPQFLWIGLSKDFELLGGNYVKINNKIYSGGQLVDSADIESFHTMEIPQLHNKSEWSITIGLDAKHIYSNENIMDKKRFTKVVYSNDSLKHIYFQKK